MHEEQDLPTGETGATDPATVTVEFRNASGLEFKDISSEEYREYIFENGSIRLDNPTHLYVSENGHRVFNAGGDSFYIPNTWICLRWRAREGQPHFDF